MSTEEQLRTTLAELVQDGRGILAADESLPTIAKRFKAVGIENTEENRRAYRVMLLTAPHIGEFISGVIFFEESLGHRDEAGRLLAVTAQQQGIVAGIKVDRGTVPLANAAGDLVTQGLDDLAGRLNGYKAQGARFAKWREVYPITDHNPTPLGVHTNAETLARYAAICQQQGVVPIVEPEVLLDGNHSLQRCAEVTETVLHSVFHALHRHRVVLELMLLKPSMVLPGKDHSQKADVQEVAQATLTVLRRTVPAAVPSINFLSGGQTPEQATAHLNAMHHLGPLPWNLSFSYARALQDPAMSAWRGKSDNVKAAQHLFQRRAELNGLAQRGQYRSQMEAAA